jgi:CTP:molybdopterin cytidylyltransferase MocA
MDSKEKTPPKKNTKTYDALILAGDRKASRKVKGKNKALLTIGKRSILSYIIEGLLGSRFIKDIYIVGPKARIEKAIKSDLKTVKDRKIVVLDQWDNLFENVWNGFLHTVPGYKEGMNPETYRGTPNYDKAVFALSGDIPLLTPYEVDELIENSDLDKYDYMPGITADFSLKYYYPKKKGKKKGIRHAYFHFKDGRFRQNNMHFGKLFRIANKIYIEKMYEHRHQREWKDIVKLAIEILRTEKGSYKSFYYYLVLQVCMSLSGMGLEYFSNKLRKFVPLSDVERSIGLVLGTRAKAVITSYGGGALDIDSDGEFEAVKENFSDWMAYQRELYEAKRGK